MILQKEIRTFAEALNVPLDTIDRDYVLGHFLKEMFKQSCASFEKCTFKNITFNDVSDLFNPERMKQVAITWDERLSHQLQK